MMVVVESAVAGWARVVAAAQALERVNLESVAASVAARLEVVEGSSAETERAVTLAAVAVQGVEDPPIGSTRPGGSPIRRRATFGSS